MSLPDRPFVREAPRTRPRKLPTDKIPVSYAAPDEHTSPKFAAAFARGCGGHATNDPTLLPGPVALFASPARRGLLIEAERQGRPYYYGDHGWFRRGKYYRVGYNVHQYQPTRDEILAAKPDRLRNCGGVTVNPDWHRNGGAIVICPNSPLYMSWYGIDAHAWVLEIVDRLGKITDRPIVVRWKSSAHRRPLYMDLDNAHAVIVFSSGAAVEALAYGVPVFVLAEWCTARSMGSGDISQINHPVYPDLRVPFLWSLATRQWTMDEISSGLAWRTIHDLAQ